MAMMEAPRNSRQKSVSGMKKSFSAWKDAAPTSEPATVRMPPTSTMTRKSTDMGIEIMVGSMEPLEKA